MKDALLNISILAFLLTPFIGAYFVFRNNQFNKLVKVNWSRKKIGSLFLGLLISSFVGIGIFAEPVEKAPEAQAEVLSANEEVEPSEQTVEAQVAEAEPQKETVEVTRIIDGDTIEIEGGQKIRYIGIDTPESKDPNRPVECFSSEATQKNEELVAGKEIRLEKDVSETDRYGRLLRYVYVDDQMVNEILVREGYAQASAYPPDVKHQDLFDSAESEAREQEKGLWGDICLEEPSPTPTSKPTSVPTAKPTVIPTTQPTVAPQPVIESNVVPTTTSSYSCSCSKTCSQMSSCDEAYYQLNTCGCSKRDGDSDGVPCESICPGG